MTWQAEVDAYIKAIDDGDAAMRAGTMTLREAEAERHAAFEAMRDSLGLDDV